MQQIVDKSSVSGNGLKRGLDMVYLANCALWDVPPQKSIIEAMDLTAVYGLAKAQSMVAVTYYGLEKWLNSLDNQNHETEMELLTKWRQARDMAIRKNTMLDIAREQILAYLEENGIWYMPLKGALLKDMYPKLGMRQMADNDILIDATFRKQVFDYMLSQGYEGEYHEGHNHDEFLKKPFYNFEIHKALITQGFHPAFDAYYRNPKEKLIKRDGCEYGFRDEEFYIYMVAHAYKHHSRAGNGVRHLMDIQVYLENKASLEWSNIQKGIAALGIEDYERTARKLAGKLFDKACRSPQEMESVLENDERELLAFSIDAGTYGSHEIRVKQDLKKLAAGEQQTALRGIRYLWSGLTNEAGLYRDFPKLANYKVLRPILYVARAVKVILFRRNRLNTEIKTVRKMRK